jgi:hypothetical protein
MVGCSEVTLWNASLPLPERSLHALTVVPLPAIEVGSNQNASRDPSAAGVNAEVVADEELVAEEELAADEELVAEEEPVADEELVAEAQLQIPYPEPSAVHTCVPGTSPGHRQAAMVAALHSWTCSTFPEQWASSRTIPIAAETNVNRNFRVMTSVLSRSQATIFRS